MRYTYKPADCFCTYFCVPHKYEKCYIYWPFCCLLWYQSNLVQQYNSTESENWQQAKTQEE